MVPMVVRGLPAWLFCSMAIAAREPFDRFDFGLGHLFDKLARIGGQRLDIAPLPFGVDGFEGKRDFARAGGAGAEGDFAAGDVSVDCFKVVLLCSLDFDDVS